MTQIFFTLVFLLSFFCYNNIDPSYKGNIGSTMIEQAIIILIGIAIFLESLLILAIRLSY